MTNGKHLTWMLLVAGGLFAVLLVAGRPVGTALSYAALLACPLMMVGMMFMMGHGNGTDAHAGSGHDQGAAGHQTNHSTGDIPAPQSHEPTRRRPAAGH